MVKIARQLMLGLVAAAAIGQLGLAQSWQPVHVSQPMPPADPNAAIDAQPGPAPGGTTLPATPPGFPPPIVGGPQPMLGTPQPMLGDPCGPYCGPALGGGECCGFGDCCGDIFCSTCPPWDCGSWCDPCGFRRWYVMADAMWLTRNDPSHRNLSHRGDGDLPVVLSTQDLDFDMEPGARITIGKFINQRTSIEGTYFGFHDWDAYAAAFSPSGQLNPYWQPEGVSGTFKAFENANVHQVNYGAELHNAELGVRRWINPDASVLFGFRFLTLDEDLDFSSIKYSTSTTGLYSIHTDNELVGLQIGGEWGRTLSADRLRVSLYGKAGLFLNFAEQDTQAIGSAGFFAEGEADDTELASLLELGVVFTLRLTDHISLRGGYNHIFLTGLALAPDQLSNPRSVNGNNFLSTEGSLHLHGPFVGGEFVFP